MFFRVRHAAVAAVITSTFAVSAFAETRAGAYLAGRQAVYESDYSAAAKYYSRALRQDPQNDRLLESVLLARLALGDVAKALPIAQQIEDRDLNSQAARMAIAANLVAEDKLDDLLARDPETQGVGPLVDGLMTAWAHMGQGAMTLAMDQFDVVSEQDGLREFALFHKAMALASVGDFEGAEAVFTSEEAVSRFSRRAALARTEVLSQLDRNADALQFLEEVFAAGSDPFIEDYTASRGNLALHPCPVRQGWHGRGVLFRWRGFEQRSRT